MTNKIRNMLTVSILCASLAVGVILVASNGTAVAAGPAVAVQTAPMPAESAPMIAQAEPEPGEEAETEAEPDAAEQAPAPAVQKIPLPKGKQPTKKNLLSNGSFEDPEDSLKGWHYDYNLPGESWYYANKNHLDVVKEFKGRKNVLHMWGDITKITDRGEGVQVDSEFVVFEKGGKYRLSLWACTTGPDCRIYFIGYTWKPGIKPDHMPIWGEVRRVYKSAVMHINSKDGAFTGAPTTWKQGFSEVPMEKGSEEALKHLNDIDFISAHIIAIGGNGGEIFFDDVVIERIK